MNKQENSNGWGGPRNGAGRKPKADEIALIEKLKPYDEVAFTKLSEGVATGDIQFLKLFMEYRFGKPKQVLEAMVEGGFILNGMRTLDNAPVLNGNGHETG